MSIRVTGQPARSRCTSIGSRVVPAMLETMAASRRTKALRRLDFPALGGPAITICTPSRTRSAAPAVASSAARPARTGANVLGDERVRVIRRDVLSEIDGRLAFGGRGDQGCAPGRRRVAHDTRKLTLRLAALQVGLGVDQVGEAFDLREVELAVQEGAAGEFARLGPPQGRLRGERAHHRRDDGGAPVQMQLRAILAELALRGLEHQHQRVVERLAGGNRAAGPASRGAAPARGPPARRRPHALAARRGARPRSPSALRRWRRRRWCLSRSMRPPALNRAGGRRALRLRR